MGAATTAAVTPVSAPRELSSDSTAYYAALGVSKTATTKEGGGDPHPIFPYLTTPPTVFSLFTGHSNFVCGVHRAPNHCVPIHEGDRHRLPVDREGTGGQHTKIFFCISLFCRPYLVDIRTTNFVFGVHRDPGF